MVPNCSRKRGIFTQKQKQKRHVQVNLYHAPLVGPPLPQKKEEEEESDVCAFGYIFLTSLIVNDSLL